jgi:predicted transposase YdaD
MVLTTSWKEEGRVEGRVEGRAEGLAEGRREASINIALQLLTYKFGALAPEVVERIRTLNITQLEALPVAIFGFVSATDLDAWIESKQ